MKRHTTLKIPGFYRDAKTSDGESAKSDNGTAKSDNGTAKSDDENGDINEECVKSLDALVVSQTHRKNKRKAVTIKRKTGHKFYVTIRITA